MDRSLRATFAVLRVLGEMAIILAVVAIILGKTSESPHAAKAPTVDGSARVAMHDDGESVRLAVGYADGENVTRFLIEDGAGKSQMTLNVFKGGGVEVAFGQGGPNQGVAWWNRDGTVAFTAQSPRSRIEHHAHPDGAVTLVIHALPTAPKISEVIKISPEGALTHESFDPPPTGDGPAQAKDAIQGRRERMREVSEVTRNNQRISVIKNPN